LGGGERKRDIISTHGNVEIIYIKMNLVALAVDFSLLL